MIDQAKANAFAEVTGDYQWIHVDVERASKTPFGGTIAHGYLTLSLVPWVNQQLCSFELGGALLNYGLNQVRFPETVLVGSRVRATCTVVEVAPARVGHQVLMQYVFQVEGAAKPSCVAETVTLVLT